jgi:hypothetical protein
MPGFHRRASWTEYTLYYLHLERTDGVERWHFVGGTEDHPTTLYSGDSVWRDDVVTVEELGRRLANPRDPSLFIVIQSSNALDPDFVREAAAVAAHAR